MFFEINKYSQYYNKKHYHTTLNYFKKMMKKFSYQTRKL